MSEFPPIAFGEAERLAALERYGILDTPPEPGFDDIVLLASQVCEAPVALVSLVAGDRQWFKARIGFELSQTPIGESVCAHALRQPGLLVIPDLSLDPRTRDNPLVTDGPRIRFYAGARLETPEGLALGTLCVIDAKARPGGLTASQASGLEALARQVMAWMELRRVMEVRDEALRTIREADTRHRQILESAIDYAIITMDLDGLVTGWNAGAERILGWSETEMLGHPARIFFTPEDDAAGIPEREMAAAREAGRGNDERWHRRKDGSRFWASGEMMPLAAEDGAHVGYLKILRDRTDQRAGEERTARTEQALALSEERQRLATEATGIGIWDYDLRTGDLDWDAQVRELFGVGPDAAVTYEGTFLPGLYPDDRIAADAAVRAAFDPEGTGTFDIEYRVRRAVDGRERWLAARGRTLFEGATAVRFVGTVRDVTARKSAESARAATEERYRLVARATNDAIWDWDLVRNHVRWNEALRSAYGHDRARVEPTGEWWIAQIHPDDRARIDASIHAVIDGTGSAWTDEYRFLRADGTYADVLDRGFMIRDGHGRAVRMIGAMLDLTERKRAERRQAALVELSDRLRDCETTAEMAFAAGEILGTTLGVSRAGYGTIDTVAETITIERDWNAPGILSLAGVLNFRDYGSYIEDLKRGETVVFEDARTDPRTSATADALDAISARSLVNMPVTERSGLVALLYLNNAAGRPWSEEDLAFVRSVADRARGAIERLRSEEARRASEEQFRVFAQAMPNHVWAGSGDGALTWFNEEVYAYSGARPGDLDGAGWARIVHPDDLEDAARVWNQALAAGAAYETEFRIRRADEAYRWFLVRGRPILAADGSVTRWVGTNTDIHDQKRVMAELTRLNDTLEQEVEERTRERNRLWETTNDLMGTAGLDGYLKAVNPAWTRMLGWDTTELLTRQFFELIDPADHAATIDVVKRLAAGETVTGFVDHLYRKDGSQRAVTWNAVPEGPVFYIVGRDITEQRQVEDQLRQSQKMEAVGQLTGGIAHDFNNLLTGIVGSLDLMQTRMAQGRTENIERYAKAAMSSANRAAALTHRLLAFARRQPLDPKPTNANTLVTSLEDLLRRTIGEAISLEIVTSGGLWPTLCDPHQLESAILNLAINARDAMPDGGTLTIETCNTHLDRAYAALHPGVIPGQYICICATDTGTGMSAEVIARAFDPFFTTKPIGQGTGLGLSMIYGFARQSEGHAKIYSEVGQGTTVKLYLPRHRGEVAAPVEPVGLTEVHRAEAGETVLVVEDEAVVRDLMLEVLHDLGYRALEAQDGPGGLKILQSPERIDLLVTDVGLPGLNGRQLADQARETRPELKVLFITGYAENAMFGNGGLDPGMQMITKPFPVEALATRIRGMIEG